MLINVPNCDMPGCTKTAAWHITALQYACVVQPPLRWAMCWDHLNPNMFLPKEEDKDGAIVQ